MTKMNVGKKLEDIPAPFSDVKNILKEIEFKDETTRSRCRGWLVLRSRNYLQADILFPGCAFDCRLNIRGRIGTIYCNGYEYVGGSITLHASYATLSRGIPRMEYPTCHLYFLTHQENTSDKWDVPWYTTRKRRITILHHAIENTVDSTITGANAQTSF